MKKKLFTLALLAISASSFAAPISTPNNINDTPIISNGGGVIGGTTGNGSQCQAYTNPGSSIDLSTPTRVTFYGGGSPYENNGGYLSVMIAPISGKGTIQKIKGDSGSFVVVNDNGGCIRYDGAGTAIGLFLNNTTDQSNFIAGVGGSGGSTLLIKNDRLNVYLDKPCEILKTVQDPNEVYSKIFGILGVNEPRYYYGQSIGGNGGGWVADGTKGTEESPYTISIPGTPYAAGSTYGLYGGGKSTWFAQDGLSGVGFYNGGLAVLRYGSTYSNNIVYEIKAGGGGASSISAFYNIPTNKYTSPGTAFTITGGGTGSLPNYSTVDAVVYVCK